MRIRGRLRRYARGDHQMSADERNGRKSDAHRRSCGRLAALAQAAATTLVFESISLISEAGRGRLNK